MIPGMKRWNFFYPKVPSPWSAAVVFHFSIFSPGFVLLRAFFISLSKRRFFSFHQSSLPYRFTRIFPIIRRRLSFFPHVSYFLQKFKIPFASKRIVEIHSGIKGEKISNRVEPLREFNEQQKWERQKRNIGNLVGDLSRRAALRWQIMSHRGKLTVMMLVPTSGKEGGASTPWEGKVVNGSQR